MCITVATHAVWDIGAKLYALSYVGWDCSVERDVSACVPSMLMTEMRRDCSAWLLVGGMPVAPRNV